MVKAPKPLVLAVENGLNALNGVPYITRENHKHHVRRSSGSTRISYIRKQIYDIFKKSYGVDVKWIKEML